MPVPQNQLDQLNAGLQDHDKRLASLEATQTDISSEIEVHNIVLQVGRDPKVLAMLGDVHDNPALADQIKSDPQGFVQSRGIQLPPGATITANMPTPHSAVVSADYHIGRFQFSLQYDKDKGFSLQMM